MDVQIIVKTTFENGKQRTHRVGRLSRPMRQTGPENIGQKLEDARVLLQQVQEALLLDQIEEISEIGRTCAGCGKMSAVHDYPTRTLDTLFGRFRSKVPRFRQCARRAENEGASRRACSPITKLFPRCATPELERLQAELASRHSFREAARLMDVFLPCAPQVNTTVRNRLGKVARKVSELEAGEIQVDEDGYRLH